MPLIFPLITSNIHLLAPSQLLLFDYKCCEMFSTFLFAIQSCILKALIFEGPCICLVQKLPGTAHGHRYVMSTVIMLYKKFICMMTQWPE